MAYQEFTSLNSYMILGHEKLHVKLVVILDTGHHLTSHSTEMQIENTYMYTYKNNINDNVYRQYVKKINLSYFIAEITFLQKL